MVISSICRNMEHFISIKWSIHHLRNSGLKMFYISTTNKMLVSLCQCRSFLPSFFHILYFSSFLCVFHEKCVLVLFLKFYTPPSFLLNTNTHQTHPLQTNKQSLTTLLTMYTTHITHTHHTHSSHTSRNVHISHTL